MLKENFGYEKNGVRQKISIFMEKNIFFPKDTSEFSYLHLWGPFYQVSFLEGTTFNKSNRHNVPLHNILRNYCGRI